MTFSEIVKNCAGDKTLAQYLDSFLEVKGNTNAIDGCKISTHVAKYTDTYISHIAYYDSEKIKSSYICTGTINNKVFDVSYSNSSFSSVAKFISSIMEDGHTVYDHLKERSTEITEGFKELGADIDDYINDIMVKEAAAPDKSHQLLKQVYFPMGDDKYHLLNVLPATVLMYETNYRISKTKKHHSIAMITSNTANQTSRLCGRMAAQNLLSSLPPVSIRADKQKEMEYIYPDIEMINSLDGVENGMLVNPDKGLDEIIKAGMPINAKRIYDYDRSEETKKEFLKIHGYSDTPPGYEIHHIVPLSVGGADSPDNMILLFSDDHSIVTRVHRDHYGWKKAS